MSDVFFLSVMSAAVGMYLYMYKHRQLFYSWYNRKFSKLTRTLVTLTLKLINRKCLDIFKL